MLNFLDDAYGYNGTPEENLEAYNLPKLEKQYSDLGYRTIPINRVVIADIIKRLWRKPREISEEIVSHVELWKNMRKIIKLI